MQNSFSPTAESRPNRRTLELVCCLLLGATLLFFANGRFIVPLATWLAPILLLRFARLQKPWAAYLWLSLVYALINLASFWGIPAPDPQSWRQYLPLAFGPLMGLIYLVDRLIEPHVRGFRSTLVFPLAYTVFDFALVNLSPLGSTGAIANTQLSNLPLMQLLSVTGLSGVTFLLMWAASTVNWAYQQGFRLESIRLGVVTYTLIFIAVMSFGGLRLLFGPMPSESVRVAGIHVTDLRVFDPELVKYLSTDRAVFRQKAMEVVDRLLAASQLEAEAGSKIIVWAEASPKIAKEQEAEVIAKAGQFAKTNGVYLAISPYIYAQDHNSRNENKLLLFDPSGNNVLTHYKYGGNLFEGTVLGDKVLRFVDTPYGRLSGMICWDQDFPALMRKAGRNRTDLMLTPSADWRAFTEHAHESILRAIENGYWVFRQTNAGLSLASDPYGRVVASMNHFGSSPWVTVAQVGTRGVRTPYAVIGDAFAWLCGFVLVVLAFLAWCRANLTRKSSSNSPTGFE